LPESGNIEPFVKPKVEKADVAKESINTEHHHGKSGEENSEILSEKTPKETKHVTPSKQTPRGLSSGRPAQPHRKTVHSKKSLRIKNKKKDDRPVRDVTPEPEKSMVTHRGEEVFQPCVKSHVKAPGPASGVHEKKKSGFSENRKEPSRPRRKTVLWAAVAAVFVVLCLGTTLVMTKKSAQRGPIGTASFKVGNGVKALEDGRFDEAVSLFDQALASEPALANKISKPYAEALQGKAAAFAKAEPEKAEELLLLSVEFDPESISTYSQLGLLYLNQRDYARAASSYEMVIQLGAETPDTFFNLGYIYAITEDYAKAERSYSRAVQLDPSFLDEALFNLAMVQDRLGKRTQCIKNLELATKANPRNKQASQYLKKLKS
jgi:Tfp pilus assembly protein PilF